MTAVLFTKDGDQHNKRLDADNPDSHCSLIIFFHKLGTTAPSTDAEKLVWAVIEVEKPTFSEFHGRSLTEANTSFLEKHKDSLVHRAAVAMLYILGLSHKAEAIKLIEDSSNNLVQKNGVLGPVK